MPMHAVLAVDVALVVARLTTENLLEGHICFSALQDHSSRCMHLRWGSTRENKTLLEWENETERERPRETDRQSERDIVQGHGARS